MTLALDVSNRKAIRKQTQNGGIISNNNRATFPCKRCFEIKQKNI